MPTMLLLLQKLSYRIRGDIISISAQYPESNGTSGSTFEDFFFPLQPASFCFVANVMTCKNKNLHMCSFGEIQSNRVNFFLQSQGYLWF